MSRWKEGTKEFTVAVNRDDSRGNQCNIPAPVMRLMGDPVKVKFVVDGKRIEILPVD
jgi:hypothetical protein